MTLIQTKSRSFVDQPHQVHNQTARVLEQLQNEDSTYIQRLVEAYSPYMTSITDPNTQKLVACGVDNVRRYIQSMDETTRALNIGSFQNWFFPMIYSLIPSLVSPQLVSTQPLRSRTSPVFFQKPTYGMSKGTTVAGQTTDDVLDEYYPTEEIPGETLATGDGATAVYDVYCAYPPVQASSVTITAGAVTGTDDGAGNITGAGITTGTINYTTGRIQITFAANVANGTAITIDYSYNMEASRLRPEMDLSVTSSAITVEEISLQVAYTLESAYALKMEQGDDAEMRMAAMMIQMARFAIDRRVVTRLWNTAANGATAVTWDKTPGSGISYTEHKESFIDTLEEGTDNIWRESSRRAAANWVLCGGEALRVVNTLPGFVPNMAGRGRGLYYAGILNGKWAIFGDPLISTTRFLLGYKGEDPMDAGFILGMYMPAYTTPTYMQTDMVVRKGLMSQFGTLAVVPKMYCRGTITTGS